MDWTGKRVLVTGSTGFIGCRLVDRLSHLGAQVYAATLPAEESEVDSRAWRVPPLPLAFDVRDGEAVRRAVGEAAPDVVFSLAAVGVTSPPKDPMTALLVNAGGVVSLMEALQGCSVARVVLVGTCHEYGDRGTIEGLDPFNAYTASKIAAWAFGRMYWRAVGLPVVTVRPFQVYGPAQPPQALIPAAVRAALAGEDFAMTPGQQTRDFVYVQDVVDGMLAAAEANGIEGTSLDLGTGTGHAIRRVVERLWQLAHAGGQLRPGALDYRPGEAMCLIADAERTFQLTGWRATTSLETGLRATIESFQPYVV
jgi:UDP-glucose 4-epimerase